MTTSENGRWVLVAEIRRNYHAFPFLWLENHAQTGKDYFLGGEDYQGQTFVQLDTGKVVNNRSVGAEQGFGFCWASYRLLGDGKTLLVDGCYWACPYELKFFDVSDPMSGWPEIDLPGGLDYLDPEKSEVSVEDDDTILWEEMDYVFKPTGERECEIDAKWSRLLHEISKAEVTEVGVANSEAPVRIEIDEDFLESCGTASLAGLISKRSPNHHFPKAVLLVFTESSLAYRRDNGGPRHYVMPEFAPFCLVDDILRMIESGVEVSIRRLEVDPE